MISDIWEGLYNEVFANKNQSLDKLQLIESPGLKEFNLKVEHEFEHLSSKFINSFTDSFIHSDFE